MAAAKQELDAASAATKQERAAADASQRELDRLGSTLRQVEQYNEQVRGARMAWHGRMGGVLVAGRQQGSSSVCQRRTASMRAQGRAL